jgi:thiosulfate/3-mercaptopyruvate sulfurtransferase
MSRSGIGSGVRVVAYDDQAGAVAARLWYLLRAYGHPSVAVLDGGIVKWTSEGRPLEAGARVPPPGAFTAQARPGWVLGKLEMLDRDVSAPVLDARAPERYRGEQEPIDPRAGHIPGARSAPYTDNLTSGAVPVLRPPEALRERYAALGAAAGEPIVYCGSGVTACHDLLALEVAGLRGRLYGGSWSEWSADPGLPVSTGDE